MVRDGQRRQVGVEVALDALPLGLPADGERDAIQLDAGQRLVVGAGRGQEDLPDPGAGALGARAEPVRLDGHVAPTEDLGALGRRVLLQDTDGARRGGLGGREEDETGGVLPRRRQVEVDRGAIELVRDLHHDAGAVTGVRLGTASTPVIEPAECVETHPQDLVRPAADHIRDQSQTAGVVFVRRVVEPVRWAGVAGMRHRHAGLLAASSIMMRDDVGPGRNWTRSRN